jgi:methylated-DNA-[protein]-cysteine S-methyltransferase
MNTEATDLMTRLVAPTTAPTPAMHLRLAQRADDEGLLDVSYAVVDSPIGSLLIASTAEGLVRVAFECDGHEDVLSGLSDSISPRILRSARRTDVVARQLDEYFAGRRRSFDVPLDLRLVRGFRRAVVEGLRGIAYGDTASYAEVAAAAGNPTAVRAAASACSHNPLPVVVPCHRVIRSDGSLGNYRGGVDAKVTLLAMERAA